MYLSCLTLQMDLSSLISTLPRHYKHTSLDHLKPPLDLSSVQCLGKQSQPACCLSDLVLIEVPQYLSIVFQALTIMVQTLWVTAAVKEEMLCGLMLKSPPVSQSLSPGVFRDASKAWWSGQT